MFAHGYEGEGSGIGAARSEPLDAHLARRGYAWAASGYRAWDTAPIGSCSTCIAECEEVASLVAYLASDLAHFINGTMIEIDGGQQKPLMDRFRDR